MAEHSLTCSMLIMAPLYMYVKELCQMAEHSLICVCERYQSAFSLLLTGYFYNPYYPSFPTRDKFFVYYTYTCTCMLPHFSSSEVVPQTHVGCEGEDRDEDWSCGPEVHTQGIEILPTTQTFQFILSVQIHLRAIYVHATCTVYIHVYMCIQIYHNFMCM